MNLAYMVGMISLNCALSLATHAGLLSIYLTSSVFYIVSPVSML